MALAVVALTFLGACLSGCELPGKQVNSSFGSVNQGIGK